MCEENQKKSAMSAKKLVPGVRMGEIHSFHVIGEIFHEVVAKLCVEDRGCKNLGVCNITFFFFNFSKNEMKSLKVEKWKKFRGTARQFEIVIIEVNI